MKLTLDILVMLGHVDSSHLMVWPEECPGYKKNMGKVFPGLPRKEWINAFHWLYRELSSRYGRPALTLPDVLMSLCWKEREDGGSCAIDTTRCRENGKEEKATATAQSAQKMQKEVMVPKQKKRSASTPSHSKQMKAMTSEKSIAL